MKLKCDGINGIESSALLKDLHDLGMKHGVNMIVVSQRRDDFKSLPNALWIDDESDPSVDAQDLADLYAKAAKYLVDVSLAVSRMAPQGPDGPEAPDCPNRATTWEGECAGAGCGFCWAARRDRPKVGGL
jgi:hypothetical protein